MMIWIDWRGIMKDKELDIISKNMFCKLYGWLNPKGEYIPCDVAKHIEMAMKILKLDTTRNAEKLLEEKGYIKLCGSGVIFGKQLLNPRWQPTPYQQDWIYKNRLKLTPLQFMTWKTILQIAYKD